MLYNQMVLSRNSDKKILIASHRGCSTGNIIENTIGAFEAALLCKTDILEMDVFQTIDKKLYVFHDGMEQRLFWNDKSVLKMKAEEVDKLRFINQNSLITNEGPPSLDDVLEHFKNRCLINLDRCWWCWDNVFSTVLKHNMQEQILFKSPAKAEYLSMIAAQDVPFMYLPITRTYEDVLLTEQASINTVAIEIVFINDSSPLITNEFIGLQHKKGRLLWANAITLCANKTLNNQCDDDHSIMSNQFVGWKRLIDLGFDIIQTDWPLLLRNYINDMD